ncbi:HD domain-containing protein [Candidatus Desantisbacteria bacterium]|nr:HD domain-containing protein [Candidatus Desantisbacteria bacterium]
MSVTQKQYVSELKEGITVKSCFVVKKKELREFKGKPEQYLSLEVGDKTGFIDAVAWENAFFYTTLFEEGDVVWINGRAGKYRNKMQLTIDSLSKYTEYNLDDFMSHTDKDVEGMTVQLFNVIGKIDNPYLKQLLDSFFSDVNFLSKFKQSPAARSVHHNYLGGLLEHTCELLQICEAVCEIYPQIDKELLLTGAILHDVGKVGELKYGLCVDYTDEGELVGHIVMGGQMVSQKIETIEGFPSPLRMNLLHLILSHHGEYDFGSPKRPKTLEACALHHADNMSAQVKRFIQIMGQKTDSTNNWTAYNSLLGRRLFCSRRL